ncbi:hypothetical protein C8R45DRAFT_1221478, partial [Mycena sanguinolenta]
MHRGTVQRVRGRALMRIHFPACTMTGPSRFFLCLSTLRRVRALAFTPTPPQAPHPSSRRCPETESLSKSVPLATFSLPQVSSRIDFVFKIYICSARNAPPNQWYVSQISESIPLIHTLWEWKRIEPTTNISGMVQTRHASCPFHHPNMVRPCVALHPHRPTFDELTMRMHALPLPVAVNVLPSSIGAAVISGH